VATCCLWPLALVLINAEGDPEGQARYSALREQLHKLGWIEGSNIQIEVRWAAGNTDRMRAHGSELIGLPVDVLVAGSTPLLTVLQQLTRTTPSRCTDACQVMSGCCAGFRTPATPISPRAVTAGVRKAPRHEIASGGGAAAVPQARGGAAGTMGIWSLG